VLMLSRVADQTPADPDLQGAQSGADRWAVGPSITVAFLI
jgi:hypothetical protein